MKYDQRLDVDAQLSAFHDRRHREAEAFRELAAQIDGDPDPGRLRVVAVGAPTLDERLAGARRLRFLGRDPVTGTARWERDGGTELHYPDGTVDRLGF